MAKNSPTEDESLIIEVAHKLLCKELGALMDTGGWVSFLTLAKEIEGFKVKERKIDKWAIYWAIHRNRACGVELSRYPLNPNWNE